MMMSKANIALTVALLILNSVFGVLQIAAFINDPLWYRPFLIVLNAVAAYMCFKLLRDERRRRRKEPKPTFRKM